jgi:hypothetical protein
VPHPPTPVGSFGVITHNRQPDGTWSARTYIRDIDGERRLVARRGRTRAAAERALRSALTDRTPPARNRLSADTRIRDIAEQWFAEIQKHVAADVKSPNTARHYRHYIDRHILPGMGAFSPASARFGSAKPQSLASTSSSPPSATAAARPQPKPAAVRSRACSGSPLARAPSRPTPSATSENSREYGAR